MQFYYRCAYYETGCSVRMMNSHKPFVVVNSLAEDKGHLLLDDEFWFKNLIKHDSRTLLATSETSCKRLKQNYPEYESHFKTFKRFELLKKINFRLHLLAKLFFFKPIKNSCIIFQGFDEIGLFFYLWVIRNWNNTTVLVLTNNISPERLLRSKWILQVLFKKLVIKSDYVFYHTDFEFELIKKIISEKELLRKFKKIKYHLLGAENSISGPLDVQQCISFFGPVMASKPIEDICNLMASDKTGRFTYKFYNISPGDYSDIQRKAGNKNIQVFNEYMSQETYLTAIAGSTYVFLPHNHLYEGKLSGIFSDCVSLCIPVISNNIAPVTEYFEQYGPMGLMYSYNDREWTSHFWIECMEADRAIYTSNMQHCRREHNEVSIVNDFVSTLRS